MGKLIDLAGRKFGRLSVIGRHDLWHGAARWKCECECGSVVYVVGRSLTTGHTKSCGCLNRERSSTANTTHGMASGSNRCASTEYRVWNSMLQRCTNPNASSYHRYGGRGVTVCERWHEFELFFADMGKRPPGSSIDRIDNNKGYEPGNCRWATRKDQQNNMSTNVIIEYRGNKKTVSQWAEIIGIKSGTLHCRLRRGWDIGGAFNRKVQVKTKRTDAGERNAKA